MQSVNFVCMIIVYLMDENGPFGEEIAARDAADPDVEDNLHILFELFDIGDDAL